MDRTAEESKDANVIAMGEELGLLYSALWQQVAGLHHKWAQYVIDDVLKAEKSRKERIKAGKTLPGDLDRRDL